MSRCLENIRWYTARVYFLYLTIPLTDKVLTYDGLSTLVFPSLKECDGFDLASLARKMAWRSFKVLEVIPMKCITRRNA